MSDLTIGILSLQGDVAENRISTESSLKERGKSGKVIEIKNPEQISEIDGLILPGGESTAIGQLALVNGSLKRIKERVDLGMPIFGICAGLILLSKNSMDHNLGKTDQPLLNLLNISVERNSFGRQRDSFEIDLFLESIQISNFRGIFIRAPSINDLGEGVEVLSKINEKIVAVKQGSIIGTSFHPELTQDLSLHKYFINMIDQINSVN